MEFDKPVYAPGDDVLVSLRAGSGSLCAYGVTDKSVQLLGGTNLVTMDSVSVRLSNCFVF